MAFSLAKLFKRGQKNAPATVESPPPRPVEKPEHERLSKTVRPNATRTFGSETAGTLDTPPPMPAMPISFGSSGRSAAASCSIPPAVAIALEPNVERVVSLPLFDVMPHLPEGLTKPIESLDRNRAVLLKATDLEKGMARGKPTVLLKDLYRQMPEAFLRPVTEADATEIAFPFDKVLKAFEQQRVRNDQHQDNNVAQFETPFLQATIEDNQRFGIPMGPIVTSPMPPVRVQLATAETIAKFEPEAAVREMVARGKPDANQRQTISLKTSSPPVPAPAVPAEEPRTASAATAAAAAASAPGAPVRIPFKLPPNGTDASASENVPALSGASVPTETSPPAPAPGAATRVPFKIAAPSEALRTAFKENPPAPFVPKADAPTAASSTAGGRKITLSLRSVLEALLPLQRSGNTPDVPATAEISFAFSLIETQLASGRVTLEPQVFEEALPEEYKKFFNRNEPAPVTLPLQEVLKNLPSDALRMREDQEVLEAGEQFVTPFSSTAEEDAKRLGKPGRPDEKSEPVKTESATVAVATPPVAEQKVVPAPAAPAPAPAVPDPAATKKPEAALPAAPTTAPTAVDGKAMLARATQVPGVKACAIAFSDGLSLAGDLSPEANAEGLCAMAPSLLQKVQNHMAATKLGELQTMTLHCASTSISFFMEGNICLSALHGGDDLSADSRRQLGALVKELSSTYS